MLLNEKIVKPATESVLQIIFSNFQVHTAGFVIVTTQRPSDTQVLMLAVRFHANADLFHWPEANLKDLR